MRRTENLRRQHEELVTEVIQINRLMGEEGWELKNAAGIHDVLMRLTGKLRVHLAMEDKVLYPTLMNAIDAQVQTMAKQFSTEMGGIAKVFNAYIEKWSSKNTIAVAPADFAKETTDIFAVLKQRIDKENSELFPLADRL